MKPKQYVYERIHLKKKFKLKLRGKRTLATTPTPFPQKNTFIVYYDHQDEIIVYMKYKEIVIIIALVSMFVPVIYKLQFYKTHSRPHKTNEAYITIYYINNIITPPPLKSLHDCFLCHARR